MGLQATLVPTMDHHYVWEHFCGVCLPRVAQIPSLDWASRLSHISVVVPVPLVGSSKL